MSALASSTANLVTHSTIASFRAVRNKISPTTSIGFVPTMGALHEGHASLVKQARLQNDVVVASVFVNPTQFAPGEDLDRYPKQLQQDRELLEELGVDHLFAPDAQSMYKSNHMVYVVPEGFDESSSEGQSRPGHFRGVATIVNKLLNIVQPTRAYFGQKDAAQCVLIKRMVDDLNMNVEICIEPTVREADGLALSSRNVYLTATERKAAPVLYKSLCAAKGLFDEQQQQQSSGSISADTLREVVLSTLKTEPLISDIQYIAIDCKETMRSLQEVSLREGAIISIACKIGSVRLIDNIIF